jgi:16S rRNA processing protein RimM
MPAVEYVKNPEFVAFGRIVGVHGLQGALRVRAENSESPDRELIKRLFIDRDGTMVEYRVRSFARAGGGSLKVNLEGIDTIEQAQALRGLTLYIASADLPAPAENEFYYFQVVGLLVETTDGQILGHIEEVFFNGAHDVWVVKDGRNEVLIPVIDDVVRRIDYEAGRATVDAIPGLLG